MYNAQVQALLANLNGLSPGWATAGLTMAAVVVALHLYRRRAARALVHPAAAVVAEAVSMAQSKRRLRSPLLVAFVRGLVVLLAALAFDDLRWGDGAESQGEMKIAVILDGSASMQTVESGATRFARAQQRVIELAREATRSGARVAVVCAAEGEVLTPVYVEQAGVIRDHVIGMQPLPTSGPVVGQAVQFAQASGASVVYVVSDGQHIVPQSAREIRVGEGLGTGGGIVSLEVTPHRPLVGEEVRVCVGVVGTPNSRPRVRVHTSDGTEHGQAELKSDGEGEGILTLKVPTTPGVLELRAELEADPDMWNNVASVDIDVRDRYRVALVGESRDAWRDALQPDGLRTRFEVAELPEPELLLDFDAVVVAPMGALDVRMADALREAIRTGIPVVLHVGCAAEGMVDPRSELLGERVEVQQADARSGELSRVAAERMPLLRESGVMGELRIGCGMERCAGGEVLIQAGTSAMLQRLGGLYLTSLSEESMDSAGWPIYAHELMEFVVGEADTDRAARLLDPRESKLISPTAASSLGEFADGPRVRSFELTPLLFVCVLVLLALEAWCVRKPGVSR